MCYHIPYFITYHAYLRRTKSYAEAVRAMGSYTNKAHSIRIAGEQNPLSNLYKCKLNSQGAVWHSVEHLYQYQRVQRDTERHTERHS